MQTVYLYDQIRMEKTKKPGIELLTNLFYLPVNENNLAHQAADSSDEGVSCKGRREDHIR